MERCLGPVPIDTCGLGDDGHEKKEASFRAEIWVLVFFQPCYHGAEISRVTWNSGVFAVPCIRDVGTGVVCERTASKGVVLVDEIVGWDGTV